MGQFTNEIAAGNLPGFQEKVSSIAAGQIAKTVAGRHGQGSCSSPRQLQFTETVADRSLHNPKAVAAGQNDRVVAAGQNDRAVATKSGKTFNDAAAGQECVGLDKRQDSMEAAAGQRCQVAPVGYRQHDVEKMAKEAAAGEGIPGRFGKLGVGEGKTTKEAAAGDGRHGRYANEAAAGDGQHGQDAKEAAGRFENEANFAEWMGNEQEAVNLIFAEDITAAEWPGSRPIGAKQRGAEKTAAAGLFGATNTAAELPGTPKTAEKMPRQVDAEHAERVVSDGGSSFEQENTTTNDKTTTNKM
ncbi:hypothetical protein FRX31_006865 [Thalictrum thalictroides]|uniref:Seed maturation protein n=1 Tax=Thalictrum thalictroides TaxID=46969 RepID=A0A7J6X384_THATH|nr:hypothetical protein FRX31_006865 [Thalictrum thalictroides]